jgi:hypothetical protein
MPNETPWAERKMGLAWEESVQQYSLVYQHKPGARIHQHLFPTFAEAKTAHTVIIVDGYCPVCKRK